MMVSGTQAFTIGANSGGGATFYYGSGNAEAAKITTGGVFNANTLQTSGTAVGTFSASKWFIQSEDSTTTRAYYTGPDASTKGVWEIYAATSTGSAVLAGRFNASANFVAQNIGLGATIPTTSGTGITFPATQSASTNANTLDDYEEGATTIYFADATSGGNAYGISAGYIKIGRFVFLQFAAYYVSSPTWTAGNTIYIRNLPFATSGEGCAGTFMLNTTLGNTVSVYAWQPNAATYFVLTQNLFTSPIIGSEMTTQLLTYGNLVYATDS